MNRQYKNGMNIARGAMLQTVSDTEKQVADIYRKAYRDMAEKAAGQKSGGLTERWQKDMSASLKERHQQLKSDVYGAVVSASRDAARLPGAANADWLDLALKKAGKSGVSDSFRNMLTRTSDEAVRQVVNGAAYLDSRRLDTRIWKNSKRARDGINRVLEQGIAQKKSAYHLAKDLEKFVNPKEWKDYDWTEVYPDIPKWLWPINVEFHAQTVARTSINHAYHLAMVESAKQNPFVTCIHWELSPDHFERQTLPFGADECDEYAYDDNYGLGAGNFPVGNVPLPHARCLCFQYSVVPESMDYYADELSRWLDGEENEMLDNAFGEWASSW